MACKHQFLAYTMKRSNNFDHKKSEQINLIDKVFEYELNVDLVYLTYSYPRNQNFIGKLKNRDRLTLKRVQLFNYQSRNWINQLAIETCVFQAYDVNLNLAQILSPILIRINCICLDKQKHVLCNIWVTTYFFPQDGIF